MMSAKEWCNKQGCNLNYAAMEAYAAYCLGESNKGLESEMYDGSGTAISIESAITLFQQMRELWGSGEFDCGPQDWEIMVKQLLAAKASLHDAEGRYEACYSQLVKEQAPKSMPDYAAVTWCEKCQSNMPLSHFCEHME